MSTAPTLTWEQTAITTVTTTTDPASVLTAISTAVGASTDWSVNASASGYLELTPVVASPVNTMKVLVAYGVNSSQIESPHNSVSNVLYVGVAPDGGTLGNPLGSTNPYGSDRWSGYWKFSPNISTNNIGSVYVLACKEVISIWLKRGSTDSWYGCIVGCLVDAPVDADGEGTPGRIYGMMVTGSDVISSAFYSSTSEFVNCNANGNADSMAGVFNPASPSSFERIRAIDMGVGEQAPRHTTQAGTRLTIPIPMYLRSSPFNLVGPLRQMRKGQDSNMRTKVQDSGGSDFSFHVTGKDSGVGVDCLSFDNG